MMVQNEAEEYAHLCSSCRSNSNM